MSIPLDDLYHYVDSLFNEHALIYRFYPHGSKNINHLWPMRNLNKFDTVTRPVIICHDQEPLNYDLYTSGQAEVQELLYTKFSPEVANLAKDKNLGVETWANIFEKKIVVHSEENSTEVTRYQEHGFETCYYWSHAVIARDWYRFAEHDPKLNQIKNIDKLFNIYSRAWTGSREYRLKFLEMLIEAGLPEHSNVKFSTQDGPIQYQYFSPQNRRLTINRHDFEKYFLPNDTNSGSSAEYSADDYNKTQFDIVLETLADDSRIHLTEKILRPIACGQPFMLVGAQGSLEFLRRYGFKTYGSIIDETYDTEPDIVRRMHLVIEAMKRAMFNPVDQDALKNIADFNRRHFFSSEFLNTVLAELKHNLQIAAKNAFVKRQSMPYSLPMDCIVNRDDPTTIKEVMDLFHHSGNSIL